MLPWLLTLSDVKFLNFISENPTVPELQRPVHILLYLRHTFLHISMKSLCYCHFLNNCYLPFAFSIHFYYLWVISDPLWIWYKGLLPLTLSSIHLIHWNRYNRRMVCISNMYVIHVWTPSAHYSHCTCFKTGRRCQIYTLEYVSH